MAHRTHIAIVLIILFHLVGLAGVFIPELKPLMLQIVPWHLLLMFLLLLFTHRTINGRFIVFFILIFIIGFAAEWVGVHKAWLFGNYAYGDTLGIKWQGIPLIVGINWFLLTYSTGVLLQRVAVKSLFARLFYGGILLTLLDFLIEPVAIRDHYWHWAGGSDIPLKNYVTWFVLSAIMLFIFEKFRFKKQGLAGPVLLIAQFVYFVFQF
ncbi:MAG: carotenoid biosynthesis protein [Mucilaginibacter sp.]